MRQPLPPAGGVRGLAEGIRPFSAARGRSLRFGEEPRWHRSFRCGLRPFRPVGVSLAEGTAGDGFAEPHAAEGIHGSSREIDVSP